MPNRRRLSSHWAPALCRAINLSRPQAGMHRAMQTTCCIKSRGGVEACCTCLHGISNGLAPATLQCSPLHCIQAESNNWDTVYRCWLAGRHKVATSDLPSALRMAPPSRSRNICPRLCKSDACVYCPSTRVLLSQLARLKGGRLLAWSHSSRSNKK